MRKECSHGSQPQTRARRRPSIGRARPPPPRGLPGCVGAMPLRGVALALLGCAALGQRAPLSLLQWNPHWQCVVWNSRNCTEEAGKALVATLEGEDVDFANLIEYADPAGILPENWTNIRNAGLCGRDSLDLIYNSARWTPVIGMWPSRGCGNGVPSSRIAKHRCTTFALLARMPGVTVESRALGHVAQSLVHHRHHRRILWRKLPNGLGPFWGMWAASASCLLPRASHC